jgi:hypothetical protein
MCASTPLAYIVLPTSDLTHPPHLDISDESDSALSRSVAKKLSVFNKISTMVPRSTTARAITLALYLSSRYAISGA